MIILNPYRYVAGGFSGAFSYSNYGGQGDRTASGTNTVAVTGNPFTPSGAGTVDNAVDGGSTNNTSEGFNFPLGASSRELDVTFGTAVEMDEFLITWSSSAASQGSWVWEAFYASAWTTCAASFTLGGTTSQTITCTPLLATQYRLRQLSGSTNSSPRLLEWTFRTRTS